MGKLMKIEKLGDDYAVVLSPAALAELHLQLGDDVWVENRGSLGSGPSDFDDQLAAARAVMQRRRSALAELAK